MSSFSFVLLIFLLPANLQQKNKSGGSTKSYRITLRRLEAKRGKGDGRFAGGGTENKSYYAVLLIYVRLKS